MSEARNLDLFDSFPEAFGHNQRAFGIGLRQDQSEFVTAKACGRIDTTDFLAETVSQLSQSCIAGVVTDRVVQLFESI